MQIINCFERALALLVSQFRDQKPDGELTNFQKLIKAISAMMQDAENVNWQLKTERWLSTAIGQQLDELGIILGLPRNINETDDQYRERLQFQIFINISSGTPEDVIRVLRFLTRASYIGYAELEFAFFMLETNGLTFPDPPNDLNDAIFQVSPAGVNYAPIVATYNNQINFVFGGDITPQPLYVVPDENEPFNLVPLEMEPYSRLLYVQAGATEFVEEGGGLAELGFPSPDAGTLAELIQKGGNFPPRR